MRDTRAVDISPGMARVVDRLRHDGDALFGSRRIRVVPVGFEEREWSQVARLRVETPTGDRYLFAKVMKPRGEGQEAIAGATARLQHDFDVTLRAAAAFRAWTDLRAVEPAACYPELLAVITREAPGEPLEGVIARQAAWPAAAGKLARLDMTLSRAGRWVAAFQQVASSGPPSPMDLGATREYIDVRLKKLVALPRASFSEADRRTVLGYFDRRAREVAPADLVDVPVHGDITPSNIMATADRVTVLDFGMAARGSRYLDIARLYSQLEFYTAKPQYRPAVIGRLQRAALEGFDPSLRADHPLFEICVVQHVVCHLLSHSRRPGPFPASVYSSHQCRRHRRWLRERAQTAAVRPAPSPETADTLR